MVSQRPLPKPFGTNDPCSNFFCPPGFSLNRTEEGGCINANIRWRGGGSHYLVPRTATFPAHMHVHTHKQQQLLGAFVILAQEHGKEKQERREVGKKEDEG